MSNKNLDEFIINRSELFLLLPRNPEIDLLDEMVSNIISDKTVVGHDRELLDEVYNRLKKSSHPMWQSPQSYGQKNVVNWSDIEKLFVKLKGDRK